MGEFDRQLQAFFRGANQIRHATESAVFWFRSVNRYAIAGDTTGEGELNSFMDSLYRLREMIPVYHESCHDLKSLINLSLIHNINADHLQVVLYGDRAANSAAEAVFVVAEVIEARLTPLDQWEGRGLPRLGYMPDVWARLLPVCKRIRKSLSFLNEHEFVRLESQLEIEETRVSKWSLANEERERERIKQRLREKIDAVRREIEAKLRPIQTAELSGKEKRKIRDDQIKLICKTAKLNGQWAKLEALAKDDPVIKATGRKVSYDIVQDAVNKK